MLRHCLTANRKLSANSFPPPCSATVPRRIGNLSRIVSYRHAPPLSHAGQETFRKQFPAAMLRRCLTPDRKPFAYSFLPSCSAAVPRLIGNLSQAVSCRHALPLSHAEQETFRKQFPAAMLRRCLTPNRKLHKKKSREEMMTISSQLFSAYAFSTEPAPWPCLALRCHA